MKRRMGESKTKFSKMFFHRLDDFIQDLINTFPESKSEIQEYFNEDTMLSNDQIEIFNDQFKPFEKLITCSEESFFTDSKYKYIDLFKNIPLYNIWNKSDFKCKVAIMKHIQGLLVCGKLNASFSSDNQNLENLVKQIQESTEKLKDSEQNQPLNPSQIDTQMKQATNTIQGLFGGSSGFSSLIGDVADELSNEMKKNPNMGPGDILGSLFNPKQDSSFNLNNLIENIASSLDTKLKSGEINKDELQAQASNMMGQLTQGDLFNQLNKPKKKVSSKKKNRKK